MLTRSVLILALTSSLTSHVSCAKRPIIGILAQDSFEQNTTDQKVSIIAASYVKMIEASGTRVVPIFINQTQSYYDHILSSINGVIFPGGSIDMSPSEITVRAAALILDRAKKMNDNGNYFPILGICQGMEILLYLSNGEMSPLTECYGLENIELPVEFIIDYKNTSLFRNARKADIRTLISTKSTVNHHRWCLTEEALKDFGLDKQWRPITINKDEKGLVFVSSMESPVYPFAAVQFHPEKTAFEWRPDENNAHTMEAISANRIFYDWLATESRKSKNSFKTPADELNALILNFEPQFTGLHGNYNDELYIFA